MATSFDCLSKDEIFSVVREGGKRRPDVCCSKHTHRVLCITSLSLLDSLPPNGRKI